MQSLHAKQKTKLVQRLEKISGESKPENKRNTRGLSRRTRKREQSPAKIVAYDFETERIKAGTPRPLYLTACGVQIYFESRIENMRHLKTILVNNFLTRELVGHKFVAWYGNGFDAYFVAAALVDDERYIIRPYLTRSHSLRGMRIILACDIDKKKPRAWEFLDGIAMLGLTGMKLEKFLDTFAPKYKKLTEAIDFENEEFDPENSEHCRYAMRDSEGLFHGMTAAQTILMKTFGEPLRVTMGGSCIRIFAAHIPEGVSVKTPRDEVVELVRDFVMRGGFCYCVRKYKGPVWKYDINQAYASAMREARLPAGFTSHVVGVLPAKGAYIARVSARKPGNRIPFYYRAETNGRLDSVFGMDEIRETWLTSVEIAQLKRERWKIVFHEAWTWDTAFSMKEYVDKLEKIRMTCEGGPNGAIGTMIKATGNHSYGKTVEQIEPIETVMAANCPAGFFPYFPEGQADALPYVWFQWSEDPEEKEYHQPQLGAFITAHVRMVVRRAALLAPESWLYADTDCVVFSESVTDRLDIDPARYGAWKVEETGATYEIIAKKVYSEIDNTKEVKKLKRSAKGLNVKKLTPKDFEDWFGGTAPEQMQVQRQNFVAVMRGAEMYRDQARAGTGGTTKVKKKSLDIARASV